MYDLDVVKVFLSEFEDGFFKADKHNTALQSSSFLGQIQILL